MQPLEDVKVHQRVLNRHPDVTEEDVATAWNNALVMRRRNFDPPSHIAAAGADTKGRIIEMVGVELEDGGVLVYHAMRLTAKMEEELGLR